MGQRVVIEKCEICPLNNDGMNCGLELDGVIKNFKVDVDIDEPHVVGSAVTIPTDCPLRKGDIAIRIQVDI